MSESESIYDTFFDRLPIGLIRFDREGVIKRANTAAAGMFAFPSQDMLQGKRLQDYLHDPADFDLLCSEIDSHGEVENLEILVRSREGELIWMRFNGSQISDSPGAEIEGALEDISEERRTHQALQESGRLAKSIIDSVSEGVALVDPQLRISVWNASMESLTGEPVQTAVGASASILYEVFEPAIREQDFQTALAGTRVRLGERAVTGSSSDEPTWYSVTLNPHTSIRGETIGVVITVHEVTDRKQADEKKDQVLLMEREQRKQAEAMSRVSQALNAVLELPTLLELICKESSDLFHVDASLVWLVDRKQQAGNVLEKIAGHGWDHERFTGMQINLDDMNNLATQVIRGREPICLNDVSETTRTGLSGVFKVRSIMAVPLFMGEDVIGVLQIIDNHKINRFDDNDIEIAMQLGRHAANAVHNAQLYDQLQEAHTELEEAYVSTLEGWARALELRDANTEGHSTRVTDMTLRLARAVGVPEEDIEHLRRGALLHDIGKMGIPDSILSKPGPLTDEEWDVMRQHPTYAFTMLSPIEHLGPAIEIPYYHHERWDGSGYPNGLAGEDIPLSARIFMVVDVYDALTSDRPYRSAWSHDEAVDYLKVESGKLFDPEMVNAILDILAAG